MLYDGQMPEEWRDGLNQRIGQNLRRKRIESNLTFNGIYARTGIDRYTIYKYESGKRTMRLDNLIWICKKMGWRLSDIIGGGRDA